MRDFYIKHKINPGDLDKDYFQPMTLQIKRGNMGSVETENVVGIVRGSELPDEYLVITAHLDHVDMEEMVDQEVILPIKFTTVQTMTDLAQWHYLK